MISDTKNRQSSEEDWRFVVQNEIVLGVGFFSEVPASPE
jgi:hypothetical protein